MYGYVRRGAITSCKAICVKVALVNIRGARDWSGVLGWVRLLCIGFEASRSVLCFTFPPGIPTQIIGDILSLLKKLFPKSPEKFSQPSSPCVDWNPVVQVISGTTLFPGLSISDALQQKQIHRISENSPIATFEATLFIWSLYFFIGMVAEVWYGVLLLSSLSISQLLYLTNLFHSLRSELSLHPVDDHPEEKGGSHSLFELYGFQSSRTSQSYIEIREKHGEDEDRGNTPKKARFRSIELKMSRLRCQSTNGEETEFRET
ncbi:hypothetical protein DFH11DRAFT_1742142 [Phellopilus nigrolimitatus]|nr:hypothetical protein DFH11DRAFT_1742142 [Phellopilus nigrolimitatus]